MTLALPRIGRSTVALVVLAPLLVGTLFAALIDPWAPPVAGRERITAVLLLNGQAYFGHVVDVPWSDTLELSGAYYFQDARGGSTELPLGLVRRGGELHQPADTMRIRRDKVLAIEELSPTSPVRAAIAAQRALRGP